MENDLVSIYENNYIKGSLIQEKADDTSADESETDESSKDSTPKTSKKKTMKNKSKPNPGEIYGDSFKRTENIFDKILREMDELGGESESVFGSSEDDASIEDGETDDFSSEEEQTFTLSELKNMTLSELASLIGGGEEEEEEEDYSFEDESFDEGDDQIPSESYGFTGGEGNYKGDQGTYDGKAKKQPATTHVKANGDADFGKSETDYDPEDTEGSEGSHLGDQGTYDGKAKKQPATDLVKGNGDANFGKAKLGYKTKSGKKDKNYF